jgi:cytochrome c553
VAKRPTKFAGAKLERSSKFRLSSQCDIERCPSNVIVSLIAVYWQVRYQLGAATTTNIQFAALSLMFPSQALLIDIASGEATAALSPNRRAVAPCRFWWRIWLASWICFLPLIYSGASLAADGKELFAPCVACHGSKAEGNATLNAPAIAGQDAAYLERQLRNFRSDRRGRHKSDALGAQMRAAAAMLADDAAVAKVATYVATLPKTIVAAPARGDLHNGNNLYHGKCGACHGGAAEGNPALKAPRLAGLDAAYIKRQFANFRDGVRGTDLQDVPGRQMALMAKALPTERDLDDVIAFIHQQGRAK